MFNAHEHRVHALRLFLMSLRAKDSRSRGRYAQLSAVWLQAAVRREQI